MMEKVPNALHFWHWRLFLDNVTERGSTSLFYFTGVWEEFLILLKWTIVFYLFTYVTSGHSHFWSFYLSLKSMKIFSPDSSSKTYAEADKKTGNILALKEHLYVLRSSPYFFVFWSQVHTFLCCEVKSILSYVVKSSPYFLMLLGQVHTFLCC